jgi:hypothetical protein
MKSGGKEPTRAELYIKTRTRKDGQPMNNVAAEIIVGLMNTTMEIHFFYLYCSFSKNFKYQ